MWVWIQRVKMAWHVNSVDPDYGILLNIGEVHAEKLGSINEIFKEKKDLADYMEKTGKPLILNIDDERLQHVASNYNKSSELLTFGKNENAQFQISISLLTTRGLILPSNIMMTTL